MTALLSFEQAPPISVPYRFFATAPWFAVLAGLTLAFHAEAALQSRWMPATLALTHLITAGFMLQAMIGALLQFVPVAAGGNVWRPRLLAGVVHPSLTVGALALAAAFLTARPGLFLFAIALLLPAVLLFVVVVGHALWRTPAGGESLPALRLAVVALGICVLLGGALALTPLAKHWTDLHALWGLGGWALLLLAGVSWTVVPMFQLTPPYPRALTRGLPAAMLVLLLASALTARWPSMPNMLALAIGLLAAGQALATLRLQQRRRRKVGDATLIFFRAAMLALLAAASLLWIGPLWPWAGAFDDGSLAIWLGMLLLPGAFVCAIAGMLYKIVPFIAWLHLQRQPSAMPAPNMHQLIDETAMHGQLRLQLAALALLLLAVIWPQLAVLAGLTFAAANLWLAINVTTGMLRYRRASTPFIGRRGAAGQDHAE